MNDWAGDSGGGTPTPLPDIEFEAVEMETVSVSAFGDALIKDATNLKTAAGEIDKQLVNPAEEHGREEQQPVGADPRQEMLHSLITTHSQRMTETRQFLEKAAMAVENLGKVSKMIVSQIGDTDALNATSVDRVQEILDKTTPGSVIKSAAENGGVGS